MNKKIIKSSVAALWGAIAFLGLTTSSMMGAIQVWNGNGGNTTVSRRWFASGLSGLLPLSRRPLHFMKVCILIVWSLLLAGLFAGPTSALALSQAYWDATSPIHASPGNGGSGNWNTTAGNTVWWVSGGSDSIWANGNIANFAGTAGTATVNTAVTANGITFTTIGYTVGGSSTLTLAGTAIITVPSSGTETISCILAGVGYNKQGAGTLYLNNTGISSASPITITAGTLEVLNSEDIGSGTGTVDMSGGSTYRCDDTGVGNSFSQSYTFSLGTGGGVFYTPTSAQILILGHAVSGTGSLTKTGPGEIRCTAANSYSGGLIVSGGVFTAGQSSTAGANSMFGVPGSFSATAIQIQNGAEIRLNGSTSISLTANQGITLGSGGSIGSITASAVFTIPTVITGSGPLTINGSINGITDVGQVTLSGINTYTGGGTTIHGGTLTIAGAGQLNSGAYADNITNNGTFTYNSTANQTLSGVISGSGALNQSGSSALALSGANTYSGKTTIANGWLVAANASGSATSTNSVTVSGGTLTGSGTASGTVTVNSGGIISATNMAGGTATLITGALTLNTGSSNLCAISSAASADEISVTGAATLGNITLTLVTLTAANTTGALATPITSGIWPIMTASGGIRAGTITINSTGVSGATGNFTTVVSGDTLYLVLNPAGTTPPVAGAIALQAVEGVPIVSSVAKILSVDSTANAGGSLSISSVSSPTGNGATATLSAPGNSGTITYTSAANLNSDTISYVLTDGFASTVGTIAVSVVANGTSDNFISGQSGGPGSVTIQAYGIPGTTYYIQQSTTSPGLPPWTDVGSATASPLGMINFTVPGPVPSPSYYRTSTTP